MSGKPLELKNGQKTIKIANMTRIVVKFEKIIKKTC